MTLHLLHFRRHAGFCGAALTLLLAAGVPATADTPAPTQAQARYEVRFMTDMIDHHHMAIMMSEICLTNATHEELKALCADIIAAQQQEIVTMQMWLQDWYGVSYAPQMTQGDMQRMERMSEMFGREFELEFLKSMIRHHWKAVVRATGCLDRAYHDALIAMCEDIVVAQVTEIETMRTWLCQWYGLCNYGPKGNVASTH
ncbi:DUF305 domain-containing protein [Luteitalea sp.]